jgi:hypothetical protein
VGAQPEAVVEQSHAVAEQHRGDVQLEFIQHPGGQQLTQQRAAPGDGDILAAGGVFGLFDGSLDPISHERAGT